MHRARLFAQHLPAFGWEPIILTVNEKYYEETPDRNLEKLLPKDLRIEKVNALQLGKFRIIGDIGLRSFFQLYKRAKQLILSEKIDFVYIPIPSFYCALLGRWLHHSTKIKYGIDYIDPWVHQFPGSEKILSRHWLSTQLATFLEPIAIKKASLITGVSEGYYKGVKERNPYLVQHALFGAMPYGGERADHLAIKHLKEVPYLFKKKTDKIQLVYAGAMLPKSYLMLEAIFKSIQANSEIFTEVEFHFIGTGKRANDPESYNIKPLAEKYNLWQTIVYEYAQRIPYLDVLIHLSNADGIFILGSTEPHYTPSKVYQGILSCKPIFGILHRECAVVEMIRQSRSGMVLDFDGEKDINTIDQNFIKSFKAYQFFFKNFEVENIDMEIFESYSAKNVTKQLATLLYNAIEKH